MTSLGRTLVRGSAWMIGFRLLVSVNGNPPQDLDYAYRRNYPAVMYHDVRASYDITDDFNAYLGVDNVKNKMPPLGLSGTGGGSGMYDTRGRFFYAGLKYNFGSH